MVTGGISLVAMVMATTALGHVDDPKRDMTAPVYEGPGYRSTAPDLSMGPDSSTALDSSVGPNSSTAAASVGFASSNVTLLSWLPVSEFAGQAFGNDCWGYTSPSGREYALMGLSDGMAVVDLLDPSDPQIINIIPGPSSTWRDIKTYSTFAYVVSEGGGGIQVVDLSDVDNGTAELSTTITLGGTEATHNVVINEDSGFLYRCGGGSNGIRIYSLGNPGLPAFVTSWTDRYVHDCEVVTYDSGPYAGREIAFLCSGFNGGWVETGLDILDVTDKSNIIQMARYQYPLGGYSHQGSLSADRQYFFLDDEADETNFSLPSKTHVIDVSDLENPVEVSDFTNGLASITHNLYVVGDLMYASNYTSGLRVFDISDPTQGVEVAWFDTFPDNNAATFDSLWSNYPFFDSGVVIGSDRQRGLFVWLIGNVGFDFSYPGGLPEEISPGGMTVAVQIDSLEAGGEVPQNPKLHYDYGKGEQQSALTPLGGNLYEATFPPIPCGVQVSFYFSAESNNGFVWRDPIGGAYTRPVSNGIEQLFADDMENDQGWQPVNLGATSGDWQRGVPVNDPSWAYDPATDGDGSGQAWLTQNQLGNTDVDDGAVQLSSPILDLSDEYASISYQYYLTLTNNNGVDRLLVEMSENGSAGPWSEVTGHDVDSGGWQSHRIEQDDLLAAGLTPGANMVIRFTANDGEPQSIVEAGLDGVIVERISCEDDGPEEDLNGDGAVDVTDLLALLAVWGNCPPKCPPDLNGDGIVDVQDLLQLLSAWT
jgi:choice-of-anchor B domain-containing protein